jgi:hypothetical protein
VVTIFFPIFFCKDVFYCVNDNFEVLKILEKRAGLTYLVRGIIGVDICHIMMLTYFI